MTTSCTTFRLFTLGIVGSAKQKLSLIFIQGYSKKSRLRTDMGLRDLVWYCHPLTIVPFLHLCNFTDRFIWLSNVQDVRSSVCEDPWHELGHLREDSPWILQYPGASMPIAGQEICSRNSQCHHAPDLRVQKPVEDRSCKSVWTAAEEVHVSCAYI